MAITTEFYLSELVWKKPYEQEKRLDQEIVKGHLCALFSKDYFIGYNYHFLPKELTSPKFYEKFDIWFYLKWIEYFPKLLKWEKITSFYKNGISYIARKFEDSYVLKCIWNKSGRKSHINDIDNYIIKQKWTGKVNNCFVKWNTFEKNYTIEVDDLEKEWQKKLNEIIINIWWATKFETK